MIYKDKRNDCIYRDKGDFIRFGGAQIAQFQHYYEMTSKLQDGIDLLTGVSFYAHSTATKEEREQLNNAIEIAQKVFDSLLERQHKIFDEIMDNDWTSRIKDGSIIEKGNEE